MSIGRIDNEAGLRRVIEETVSLPGVVPSQNAGSVALVKAGVPSDEDFPETPQDGVLALDNEEGVLYVRSEDEWVAV